MWKQQRDKKYRFFEQYKDPLTNKQKTVSVTMNDDKKKTAKQAQIILNNKINKIISQVKRTTLIHCILQNRSTQLCNIIIHSCVMKKAIV